MSKAQFAGFVGLGLFCVVLIQVLLRLGAPTWTPFLVAGLGASVVSISIGERTSRQVRDE